MNKKTFEKITARIKGWIYHLRSLRLTKKDVVDFHKTYQQTLLDKNFKIQELQKETLEQMKTIKRYERADKWRKKFIDITLGDPKLGDGSGPEPMDGKGRKEYVARVAGFHTDILSKKIEHMIANADRVLEDMSNDHFFDRTMKGVVFAFRELFVWGETMVNEQLANQRKGTEDKEDDKDQSS